MSAIEKGQDKPQGAGSESFDASPTLADLVAERGLRKVGGETDPVPRRSSDKEVDLSDQKSNESNAVHWLQILAAVGIPLLLAYLALVSLVNPQFAEMRELIRSNLNAIISNRDAIAANSSSIARLEDRLNSNIESLDARIDSSIESLESRIDGRIDSLESRIDGRIDSLESRIDLMAELLILSATNDNLTEAELRNVLNAGEQ